MEKFSISFAGAGKVASALSAELNRKGHHIDYIVSPNRDKGTALASLYGASWSDKLQFPDSTNIIIVAVPDRELPGVLLSVTCNSNTIIVHTAGSYGQELFPPSVRRHGVFYPLQTFTEGRAVSFKEISVLIEADSNETLKALFSLAESMNCRPAELDTANRQMIHLAAVFVSNFTNFMLTSGETIARRQGFSLDLFYPLVNEVINKAIDMGPGKSQTGPAVRHDLNTIEKHLNLLSFSPELQGIYRHLSEEIMKYYKAKENE